VYNHAGEVGGVVRGVLALGMHVLVVDDGSTDGSGDRAREAGAPVIAHDRNRGKGVALVTGFRKLAEDGFTHAVVLDADGQHHPSDAAAMVAESTVHPEAVVVGVRDLSGEHVPAASRFGRELSNRWVRYVSGVDPVDAQCGFRVYPLGRVAALRPMGKRYDFEQAILVKLLWKGAPLRTVPIAVHYPPAEERITHFHRMHDNAWISYVFFRLWLRRYLWPFGLLRPVHGFAWADPWGGQQRGSRAVVAAIYKVAEVVGPQLGRLLVEPTLTGTLYLRPLVRRACGQLQRALYGPRGWGVEQRWTWSQLRGFAGTMLDRGRLLRRGTEPLEVERVGAEHLEPRESGRGGVILLGAHLGSFQLATELVARGGLDVERAEVQSRHQRPHRFLEHPEPEVCGAARRLEWSGMREGAELLRAALEAGKAVAIPGDRPFGQDSVAVRFLGRTVLFPSLPFSLAASTEVQIVPVFCLRVGANRYRLIALQALGIHRREGEGERDALHRWVQSWASLLEEQVRRFPGQWFNFHAPGCGGPEIPAQPESDGAGAPSG
jgi:predicted LPLAT superfamily acyltransferase